MHGCAKKSQTEKILKVGSPQKLRLLIKARASIFYRKIQIKKDGDGI